MSDETEQFILGDAAADALSEGRRGLFGRRKKSKKDEALTHCENCGAPLSGAYCAQCGQHAIDYRRSLWRVLMDAADSFLNWDTKFLKSIGVLLIKPWKLTNDFNAGRRARYVHPLRLYLLASIAFLLYAELVNLTPSNSIDLSAEDRAEFDAALGKLVAPDSALTPEQRAKVEAARALFAGAANDTLSTDETRCPDRSALGEAARLRALKKQLKEKDALKIEAILDKVPHPIPLRTSGPGRSIHSERSRMFRRCCPAPFRAFATPKKNPGIHFDGPDGKNSPFGAWLESRVKEKVGEDGTKAQLFLDTLRSNVPTMMFGCIPLFAFVLKMLYVRKRRYYVEHLVYALHIHTFAYVSVVVITLIGMALARWSETARVLVVVFLSCVVFLQVFISIRRVYGQGWFFTTFKFLLGGFAYLMILVFAVAATAFVTLLLP